MDRLREQLDMSFEELEWSLKAEYDRGFAQSVREALEAVDEWILGQRDRRRYEVQDKRERTIETVMGISMTFKRRYYRDHEESRYVGLLDELLGMPRDDQLSPGLKEVAVALGVSGPSYRAAAEHLAASHGHRVLSHESIRQAVLSTGRAAAKQEAMKRQEPNGKKRVNVLWVEVDGVNAHLQREERGRVEEKVLMTHEGWKRRHPGSEEYEVVNQTFFAAHDEKTTGRRPVVTS